jgi:cytoskeletal protein CcmA (bactofilin family)
MILSLSLDVSHIRSARTGGRNNPFIDFSGGAMSKKQKQKSSGDTATILTLLGRDTVIEGNLTFKETIRVDGRINGKLISQDGTVIIGEDAVVDADVQVGVAIIRGKINGRVEAAQRIEIHAPAQVSGDIIAPAVAIDSGVVFNGNCKMQNSGSKSIQPPEKTPSIASADSTDDQKDTKKL